MNKFNIILFCLVIGICGCAVIKPAQPNLPVPPTVKVKLNNTLVHTNNIKPYIQITNIIITWDCNYSESNDETVIVGSPDLTVPLSKWPVVFIGATNRLIWNTTTNPQMFFAAYNTNRLTGAGSVYATK